jgi:hypothetical protein
MLLNLFEAMPRNWQGIALPEIKGILNGKAEPFRTAGRHSRKSAQIFNAYLELTLH